VSINLTQVDDLLRSVVRAGEQPAAHLAVADDATSAVFHDLQTWSKGARRAEPEIMPTGERELLAGRLDDALAEHELARTGIETAFGSGTWMSDAVTQRSAVVGEARRVLLDPSIGRERANLAKELLEGNRYSVRNAQKALEEGNVDYLADADGIMAREVDQATPEWFARALRFATM
jgi:hypothetical protein